MHMLETTFNDLVEVASDGFGRTLEGRRGESTWTIRVLDDVPPAAVSPAMRSHLAQPLHPAVLPVEVGTLSDAATYLAAPLRGQPLARLLRTTSDAAVLRPTAAVAAAITLADAAIVLSEAALPEARCLGPVGPNNVFLDPQQPGRVWILPLWPAPARTCDWLRRQPEDLMFVGRDALRQVRSSRSDAFTIGALLAALVGGRAAVAFAGPERDMAELLRITVHGSHPLLRVDPPAGAIGALIARAIGRGETPLDASQLYDALMALRRAQDPMVRASELARDGKALEAQAVLRRGLQDSGGAWPLALLKAQLEAQQGHRERAAGTLRGLLTQIPTCRAAIMVAASLSSAPDECLALLRTAITLDPLDLECRLVEAHALRRVERIDEAIVAYAETHRLATVDPQQRILEGRAAIGLGELFMDAGDARRAVAVIRPYLEPGVDPEVRVDALFIAGSVEHKLGRFAQAAPPLREALRLDEVLQPRGPRPKLLNQLAYTLVALGGRADAAALAERSLRQDPTQVRLVGFLMALRDRPPQAAGGPT